MTQDELLLHGLIETVRDTTVYSRERCQARRDENVRVLAL